MCFWPHYGLVVHTIVSWEQSSSLCLNSGVAALRRLRPTEATPFSPGRLQVTAVTFYFF